MPIVAIQPERFRADDFYDFVHLTNEGADAVGDLVAQELCPFLAERFADKARSACGESSSGAARATS